MRRPFRLAVLALGLVVAGCTAATPPPAEVAPAERLPRILSATIQMPLGDESSGATAERPLEPGDSFIPSSGCLVEITLAPSPDAGWYRAVRLDGAVPPYLEELTYRSVLQFAVPAGEPGSVATLTLPPLDGAPQTIFRMMRAERPTARLEVNAGGAWQAADPFRIYSGRDLALRYAFTAPMDRTSVEASLRQAVMGFRHSPLEGAVLSWPNDQTLEVRWQQAPPVIAMSLASAAGQNGLYMSGSVPGVHTGAAPYLAAVNPATGAERRVRELAPEGFYAETVRGGQLLRLDAFEIRAGQNNQARTWLYDLKAGTTRTVAYLWNGLLVPATGEARVYQYEGKVPMGYGLGPISPDGAQRLFVRPPKENVTPGVIAEVTLEVGLPDGGGRKSVSEGVRVRQGRFEKGPAMAWAPDGTRIIFTSAVDEKSVDLMLLDLAGGGARKVATVPAFYSWHIPGPTMQWVGSRVLAGDRVVDVNSGKVLQSWPGNWATCWLSPDGTHVLLGTFDNATGDSRAWGPITILAIDSGERLQVGEGLPAGWSDTGEALIVRWENAGYRFAPPGM